MGKLFGTDGIRGKVNEFPMTSETVRSIGRAIAHVFKLKQNRSQIIVGKDTRLSGKMFEKALISGICETGINVKLSGILPTPGVAFLVSSTDAIAGIVVSASHNPYDDNGIKVFNHEGYKLTNEAESQIEKFALDPNFIDLYQGNMEIGKVSEIKDSVDQYLGFLIQSVSNAHLFKQLKIVLDCSNGAAFEVAPKLFSELGVELESIFIRPDGKNINQDCGSEHPEVLSQMVLETEADLGLAFDGDGDRLIAADEKGEILTGDQILGVCAGHLKKENKLKNNMVVSTIMSNLGLGMALKNMGINHHKTKVGDRYVMEEMVKRGSVLGGENSGHTIFLDHQTTGDGILTALKLIEAILKAQKPLSKLAKIITLFPQVLINVDVKKKPELEMIPGLKQAVQSIENELKGKGRVLIRYSGTQSQCRVMVEGPNEDITRKFCLELSDIINKNIG